MPSLASAPAWSAEAGLEPLLGTPGKLLVEENFAGPKLKPPLVTKKGDWHLSGTALVGREIEAQHHPAIFMVETPFRDSIVRIAFKLDGAKLFTAAFHTTKGHLMRITAGEAGLALIKDQDAEHLVNLAKAQGKLEPGQWYSLQIEFRGSKIAAECDNGLQLSASDPAFDVEKAGYRFLISGATGSLARLKIWEIK